MRITINDFIETFKTHRAEEGAYKDPLINDLKKIYIELLKQGLSGDQEVSDEQEFEIIKLVASYSQNESSALQKGLYRNKPEKLMLAVDYLYRVEMLTQENYNLIQERQIIKESLDVLYNNKNSYIEGVIVLVAAGILNQQNFNALNVHTITKVCMMGEIYKKLEKCGIAFNQEIFNKLNVAGNLQKIDIILFFFDKFLIDQDAKSRLIKESLENNILLRLDLKYINKVLSNLKRQNLLTSSNYLAILSVIHRITVVVAAFDTFGNFLTQENLDRLFTAENRWLLSDRAKEIVWDRLDSRSLGSHFDSLLSLATKKNPESEVSSYIDQYILFKKIKEQRVSGTSQTLFFSSNHTNGQSSEQSRPRP